MPDTMPDVIEFDEDNNFHLWELKLITSSEAWNGKFFGQMMLCHFLFTTEPWNELVGRFAFSGQKPNFKGEVGKLLMHLSSYGSGELAEESDPTANFKTWNLCICGGSGYELAAAYNPVAWSFWIIAEEYFKESCQILRFGTSFQPKMVSLLKRCRNFLLMRRQAFILSHWRHILLCIIARKCSCLPTTESCRLTSRCRRWVRSLP